MPRAGEARRWDRRSCCHAHRRQLPPDCRVPWRRRRNQALARRRAGTGSGRRSERTTGAAVVTPATARPHTAPRTSESSASDEAMIPTATSAPPRPPQCGWIEIEQIELGRSGRESLERRIIAVASAEHRDARVAYHVSLEQPPGRIAGRDPPSGPLAAAERVARDVGHARRPFARHRDRCDQPAELIDPRPRPVGGSGREPRRTRRVRDRPAPCERTAR
jgi:hypothetical protein